MSLQDELCLRAVHIPHAELLRLMGYASINGKNMMRLRRVLEDPHLGLGQASFDFKFGSEQFVRKLSQVLGVAQTKVDSEVDAIKQWLLEERTAFKPYLFVDTGFRRTGQPIFVLAMCEGMRRIGFTEQFWRKPLAEQVALAQQRASEHMQKTSGQLGVWGSIRQYWFYYTPDNRVEISTRGEVLNDVMSSPPARATLTSGIERVLSSGTLDHSKGK